MRLPNKMAINNMPVQLANFKPEGEKLVFTPVTAAAATYEGDVGSIWSVASDGTLVRELDRSLEAFDSLQSAVEQHVMERHDLTDQLAQEAGEVADLQDALDQLYTPDPGGPDYLAFTME